MDKPHKPSQVAVAKREEIVWYSGLDGADANTSKNVNERSFIKRMVLRSLIGRVLSHMIEQNAALKPNLYCMRKARPRNAELKIPFRPSGQKLERVKVDQAHFMAKPQFLHLIFAGRTHQRNVFKWIKGRGIMYRRDEIVKKGRHEPASIP